MVAFLSPTFMHYFAQSDSRFDQLETGSICHRSIKMSNHILKLWPFYLLSPCDPLWHFKGGVLASLQVPLECPNKQFPRNTYCRKVKIMCPYSVWDSVTFVCFKKNSDSEFPGLKKRVQWSAAFHLGAPLTPVGHSGCHTKSRCSISGQWSCSLTPPVEQISFSGLCKTAF